MQTWLLNSQLCWPSEVFFGGRPSESVRLRTSDSCRPVWLETWWRALLFRADSGADWLVSCFSGSEPTLTNAFLVLVRAEVTEPIAKTRSKASLGIDWRYPESHFTHKMLKLDSIFVSSYLPSAADKPRAKTPTRLSQTSAFNFIFGDVNRRRIND